MRAPDLAGDGTQPNPEAQRMLEEAAAKRAAAKDLADKVGMLPWYHTIDLGDGVVTPGGHDHREFVRHVGLPDDLTGLRVLDVATFDGFWAFEFERRGAEVVGIDLPTSADLDWPWGAREIVQAEKLEVPMGEGFRLAAEALGSKAERATCNVYDLPTSGLGPFDLCFIGDVLLHLARPLDALKAVRSVCAGQLILVDRYDPTITGTGDSLLRYHGGWHEMQWWAASLETLQQWVVDAGFEAPTLHGTFKVRGHDRTNPGFDRAVLHTRVRDPLS
jgi:tRNA (mo5U34)-methyltransferase